MKKGILLVIAALGLAFFAVPDAHAGWWHRGPDLDLRLSGSNFITSSTDGRPTPIDPTAPQAITALASGIAKGKSGRSLFSAQTVLEPAGALPDLCGMLGGAALSTTSVLTYNDGSVLSLVTANVEGEPPTSYYCTDGTDFTVEFGGTIAGGTGRFEGATGTWEGTADTIGGTGIVTSHIMVDLDKGSRSHHDHGDRD